jgi:hypothetical protein
MLQTRNTGSETGQSLPTVFVGEYSESFKQHRILADSKILVLNFFVKPFLTLLKDTKCWSLLLTRLYKTLHVACLICVTFDAQFKAETPG